MDTKNKDLGDFVEKFFWRSALTRDFPKATRFDRSIVIPNIRKDVNAKITLRINGTHDHYEGFSCHIIHKDNGLVEDKWFGFREYLPKPKDSTQDSHMVIAYVGPDWYCSVAPKPDEIKNMVAKISEYIKLWA